MSKTSLSKAEKEEIIRWSLEKDEGISVFTHSAATKNKLVRAGGVVKNISRIEGREVAWWIRLEHATFKPRYPGKRRKASSKVLDSLQKARSMAPTPVGAGPAEDNKPETTPDPEKT